MYSVGLLQGLNEIRGTFWNPVVRRWSVTGILFGNYQQSKELDEIEIAEKDKALAEMKAEKDKALAEIARLKQQIAEAENKK